MKSASLWRYTIGERDTMVILSNREVLAVSKEIRYHIKQISEQVTKKADGEFVI